MLHETIKPMVNEPLFHFHLPAYKVIPDVGLYLEQVTKYISELLSPLSGVTLTGSMISNYVKHKIIPNPIKKQYNRDQIALLIFIAVTKTVISLEEIQLILQIQSELVTLETFFDYFCKELTLALQATCGHPEDADDVSSTSVVSSSSASPFNASPTTASSTAVSHSETDSLQEYKLLLRKVILTAANSIWLERYLTQLRIQKEQGEAQK